MINNFCNHAFWLIVVGAAFLLGSSSAVASNVNHEKTAWYQCYSWIEGYENDYVCELGGTRTVKAVYQGSSVHGSWTWLEGDTYSCAPDVYDHENRFSRECVPPPPVCESPTYEDPSSGECVAPTEVSYENFDTQTVETVYIEETSPEPTQNCATDSAGNDVCLTSDPSTFTINGQSASPEAGVSCGWKNGAYDCISDDSCTDFNGEQVCTSPYGNIITSSDPQGLVFIKNLPWGAP